MAHHEELSFPTSLLGHQLLPTLLCPGPSLSVIPWGQGFVFFFKRGCLMQTVSESTEGGSQARWGVAPGAWRVAAGKGQFFRVWKCYRCPRVPGDLRTGPSSSW